MENQNQANPGHILKKFPNENLSKRKNLKVIFISIGVVLAGVLSGWLISGEGIASITDRSSSVENIDSTSTEAGFEDESLFPDNAEGTLREGGIEGEGTHHLERPGGASQTVYLTSTIIDLQSYVGKNVMIWGETLSAVNAPWLMDVGKLKVVK